MQTPTCDADCTRMGWIEAETGDGMADLHVSYPPGTDLDDHYLAFCHDEQEMIRVAGWQATYHDIITNVPDAAAHPAAVPVPERS